MLLIYFLCYLSDILLYRGEYMDFVEFGKRVKQRRLELGYTQEKLAELTDLTNTYIGAIERATSKCSVETVVKLANVLNLDIDYLLLGITPNNIDCKFSEMLHSLPSKRRSLFIDLCEAIYEKLKW